MGDYKFPTIAGIYQKWSIWWVDFPQPIGKHPGLVVTDDITANPNSSTVQVLPISSVREDDKNKWYWRYCVPVKLEFNRISAINCAEIHCVDKRLFIDRIGTLVDTGAIAFIEQCIQYAMTGVDNINPLNPSGNHPENYVPYYKRYGCGCTKYDGARNVAIETHPIAEVPKADATLCVSEEYIKTLTKDSVRCSKLAEQFIGCKHLMLKNKSPEDLIELLASTVREVGFKEIESDPKMKLRYIKCLNAIEAGTDVKYVGHDNLTAVIAAAFM